MQESSVPKPKKQPAKAKAGNKNNKKTSGPLQRAWTFSKDAIEVGWLSVKQNPKLFLVLGLILALLTLVFSALEDSIESNLVLTIVKLVDWVIRTVILMDVIYIVLDFLAKKPVSLKSLFQSFKDQKKLLTLMIASALFGLVVSIGAVLLIIPGLYFASRFILYPFLIVEKNAKLIDSFKLSWQMTHKYQLAMILLILMVVLLNIVGTLFFFVGLILTLPISLVALGYAYDMVKKK